MSANFSKIPLAEQQRLLEIIYAEFAQNGYQGASTNAIVSKAGIPKGTLFYYFGSKKAMFLYALDEAVRQFTLFMDGQADEPRPGGLFEGMLHTMRMKLRFVQQQPLLYRFFYKAFLEIPPDLADDMAARFAAYAEASQGKTEASLDAGLLKAGVDARAAVRMTQTLLEGLLNRMMPRLKEATAQESLRLVDEMEAEARVYFEMIRRGIYR